MLTKGCSHKIVSLLCVWSAILLRKVCKIDWAVLHNTIVFSIYHQSVVVSGQPFEDNIINLGF